MEVSKRTCGIFLAVAVAAVATSWSIGCNGDDNRVPTTADIKQANTNSIKTIESMPMPEDAKKLLESHVGGPPYTNPAIAAAQSHGANVKPGGRQF